MGQSEFVDHPKNSGTNLALIIEVRKMRTCRTKAEDDNERAEPITIASSTLLIFTCFHLNYIISHPINKTKNKGASIYVKHLLHYI